MNAVEAYLDRLHEIHGTKRGTPELLAADLARHAREARRRLFRQDMAAVAPLRQALEQALGLHFHDREGEAFFRSSLVQTLFYGLFSGWMLWRQGRHQPGPYPVSPGIPEE